MHVLSICKLLGTLLHPPHYNPLPPHSSTSPYEPVASGLPANVSENQYSSRRTSSPSASCPQTPLPSAYWFQKWRKWSKLTQLIPPPTWIAHPKFQHTLHRTSCHPNFVRFERSQASRTSTWYQVHIRRLRISLAACGALGPAQQSARSNVPGKIASRNWTHQTDALGLQSSQRVLLSVVRWTVSRSCPSPREKPIWPTACKINPRFRLWGYALWN